MCGCKGIGIFCRSEGQARAKQWGKLSQPVVLAVLQGKGPVRKRSLSEKSTLLLWCIKVMGLCGQEQTNANYLSELEFSELTEFIFFLPFAVQLRVRAGRTWWPCVAAGA